MNGRMCRIIYNELVPPQSAALTGLFGKGAPLKPNHLIIPQISKRYEMKKHEAGIA